MPLLMPAAAAADFDAGTFSIDITPPLFEFSRLFISRQIYFISFSRHFSSPLLSSLHATRFRRRCRHAADAATPDSFRRLRRCRHADVHYAFHCRRLMLHATPLPFDAIDAVAAAFASFLC
jgi:hypothetical protein